MSQFREAVCYAGTKQIPSVTLADMIHISLVALSPDKHICNIIVMLTGTPFLFVVNNCVIAVDECFADSEVSTGRLEARNSRMFTQLHGVLANKQSNVHLSSRSPGKQTVECSPSFTESWQTNSRMFTYLHGVLANKQSNVHLSSRSPSKQTVECSPSFTESWQTNSRMFT